MSIALTTRVYEAVNAIDTGSIDPVVDPQDGYIYVLNTMNKELGSIIYTKFGRESRFPLESWTVTYGNRHIINDIILNPAMITSRLEVIVDLLIPGEIREEFDPMVIPNGYIKQPTEPSDGPDVTLINHKSVTLQQRKRA